MREFDANIFAFSSPLLP